MNYKLPFQIEQEETKRLREELAITKLKLELAESKIKRATTPVITSSTTVNVETVINNLYLRGIVA